MLSWAAHLTQLLAQCFLPQGRRRRPSDSALATTRPPRLARAFCLTAFLGMFTCDVGSCLHRVTHMYAYSSFEERDQVRARAAADLRWRQFIALSRPHVQYQVDGEQGPQGRGPKHMRAFIALGLTVERAERMRLFSTCAGGAVMLGWGLRLSIGP